MLVPIGTALKHVQVREYVRGLIADLPEGAPAPSERGLMQHFGVARMTVRQAIDALVAEGLLERAPARGTFVCKNPRPVTRPLSFTEDAKARGWTTTTENLASGLGQAGMAFDGWPTISEYSSALDRVGMSAKLVETEPWTWQ